MEHVPTSAASPSPLPTGAAPPTSNIALGDPFCVACGYRLTGLTDSSCCPECGRPLVDVLVRQRPTFAERTRRYRSSATLFGLPLIDIAFGPSGTERYGRARGIIALGDVAQGVIAVGGAAFGVVAIGGLSVGFLTSYGGLAAGLLPLGGFAVGGAATGGMTVGVLASGGLAVGVVAQGGMAVGVYAKGGSVVGAHTISNASSDPEAVAMFQRLSFIAGSPNGPPAGMLGRPLAISIGLSAIVFMVVLVICSRAGIGVPSRAAQNPRGM